MSPRLPHRRLAALALLAHAVPAALCARFEAAPALAVPEWEARLRAQGSDEDVSDQDSRTYQRVRKAGDLRKAEYGFLNFNRDLLKVDFQVKDSALSSYLSGYGYTKKDLAGIKAWHEEARQAAYRDAVKRGRGQADLDAVYASLKTQYDGRIKAYLASRGFELLPGNTLQADLPAIVRKNAAPMKAVALAFEAISTSRRYDSDRLIGAAASMIQTAFVYKLPPVMQGERHTGGLLPPVLAMVSGWGDCDTKTALLASILSNWPHMRMVGVDLPEHYLMGVLRIPAKGDLFVEHGGLQFVLVEPAGPAWLPPGQVGAQTMALLESNEHYRLQPF